MIYYRIIKIISYISYFHICIIIPMIFILIRCIMHINLYIIKVEYQIFF